MSPARNPLAYHSDYFGACAVEANGAPRPFLRCRAADETPGVKRRAGGGVSRARGLDSTGQAQKKRSRPGNCARRRRLLKALKATPAPAFYLLVSYRTLALVGPARRRGVFRSILRQPKRRVYAASGAGEAEEHAIFAWPSFVRVRCLQYDARGSSVRSCGETAAEARVARTNPVAGRVQTDSSQQRPAQSS